MNSILKSLLKTQKDKIEDLLEEYEHNNISSKETLDRLKYLIINHLISNV
ncbi:MAG: hypothetical protein Q4E83_04665 [bacterium]|nr:hypothetical protein [bacterium]